jgi:hypothetical protein
MGGKKSSAPDYGPLAEASKEAAKIMADLGYAELDFAKLAYDETKPLLFENLIAKLRLFLPVLDEAGES